MRRRRTLREPAIALINVVFLMLIFFMVAGRLAPPMPGELRLVRTTGLDGTVPPDVLVVHADGRLSADGRPVSDPAGWLGTASPTGRAVVRLMPDRALPAADLLALARTLRAAGADDIRLVAERAPR